MAHRGHARRDPRHLLASPKRLAQGMIKSAERGRDITHDGNEGQAHDLVSDAIVIDT
jgi:hypothetical protein